MAVRFLRNNNGDLGLTTLRLSILISSLLFLPGATPAATHEFRRVSLSTPNMAGSAKDVTALIAFRKAITSDSSEALLNWDYDRNHFCNWTGVQCNARKWRVTGLDLRNMSLQGTIPSHLGNMSFLQYLDLSLNRLGGRIPPELGRLRRLKVLFLNGNLLEGPISSALGDCLRLTELHLSKNNFNGSIPHQLGQLSNLRVLSCWGSGLTGIIPDALGNCSMLQLIDLSENSLSGRIPFQLGFLTRLQRLQLDQNHLTGQIPPHLLNCTELRNLSLPDNRLSGPIPSHIGASLPNLQYLLLWRNKFNGRIPKSVANCSNLSHLELSWNELTGVIPQELGNLPNLKVANLFSNRFVSGSTTTIPILEALCNCSKLSKLDLSFNDLTGTLPKAVGRLSPNLIYLSLDGNSVDGKIPEEIGNLTALIELYTASNSLVGSIPSTIGSLINLHLISLSVNKLEGNIPDEVGRMESLEFVELFGNILSGEIPKVLGRLHNLRELDLSINQLFGTIPPEIGLCAYLERLDMSFNNLSGNIPVEVANLRYIQFYWNLSNNVLTGPLPAELGGMQMVQEIDISGNKLSGAIPNGISGCVGLQYLNLSHNQLRGIVPASIGLGLKSLQDMDLSFNELSGPIPSSMTKLTMLSHLNFSYNSFTGPVPREGAFINMSIASFLGNHDLCGPWLGLRPCSPSSNKNGHRDFIKKRIILVVSIVGIFVIMCCFAVGFWTYYKNGKRVLVKASSLRLGHLRISTHELSKATDDYNPRNLIGIGGYASVYRGILQGGMIVAVKIFNSSKDEASEKSFQKECRTLGKVRHRNLVKIITACSTADFKALVLPFMCNGSLDKHLHRERENECEDEGSRDAPVDALDLKLRTRILCDVAHGMSYLHHCCCPPIVHCDLKPQNVLLDEHMTAHVADFGIARLLSVDGEDSTTTSTLQGSIGYIPPEYGLGGGASSKGDAYSYGILILETITGKRPTDELFGRPGLTLRAWVSEAFPHRLREVIEDGVLETSNQTTSDETLTAVNCLAQVGLWCTCRAPENRPTMQQVERMMENMVVSNHYGNVEIPWVESREASGSTCLNPPLPPPLQVTDQTVPTNDFDLIAVSE